MFCLVFMIDLALVIDLPAVASLMLLAVFSQLVKDYRTTVRCRQELERSIKAEKYKMAEYDLSYWN